MPPGKTVEKIRKLVLPLVERMNFDLIDIEYVRESSGWYLRIYIDKAGGITIDDCELISKELSDILDIQDPISHSYILEVSSPGLDRPLKTESDFTRYSGESVEVYLMNAKTDSVIADEDQNISKSKRKRKETNKKNQDNAINTIIEGRLVKLEDGILYLVDEKEKTVEVNMDSVVMVKRAIKFV